MFYKGYLKTPTYTVDLEIIEGSVRSQKNRIDVIKIDPDNVGEVEKFALSGFIDWEPGIRTHKLISSIIEPKNHNSEIPIEIYGDNKYYKDLMEVKEKIRLKLFSKEHTKIDNFQFTVEGNVHEVECEEVVEGNRYYRYTLEKNGELVKLQYKYKDMEYYLERINDKTYRVQKHDGFEYQTILETGVQDIEFGTANYRDMSYLNMIKDLSWQQDKEYVVTDTKELFDDLIRNLQKTVEEDGFIGIDLETTGLHVVNSPYKDVVVGIVMSYKDNQSAYIPLRHEKIDNLEIDYVVEKLKPIFKHGNICTANGGFEIRGLMEFGITDVNIVLDIFELVYLTDHSSYGPRRNLEAIITKLFKVDTLALSDIFTGEIEFHKLPKDIVKAYACPDADFTRMACLKQIQELPNDSKLILAEDITAIKNVAKYSEYDGVPLDKELVETLNRQNSEDIKTLENLAMRIAKRQFELTSDDQIRQVMYEELGYPKIVVMKDNPNKASTAKRALKELQGIALKEPRDASDELFLPEDIMSAQGDGEILIRADKFNSMEYPLAYVIAKHRNLSKLQSTFFKALIDASNERDGKYYVNYRMFTAETGRIISVVQQMIKSLRKAFLPGEGYYYILCDWRQVEYRLMAVLSQTKRVIKQLRDNPEIDPHSISASEMYGVPVEEVTSAMRAEGKIWNFAVPYGVGDFSATEMLHSYPITEEKLRTTRLSKATYLESLYEIDEMLENYRANAYRDGYVKTKTGRYRYFTYELASYENSIKNSVRNKAGNMPIQGWAADIFKMCFNNLCHRIEKESELNPEFSKIRIPFLIHDEYVLRVPKTINPYQILKILIEELEFDLTCFGFEEVAPLQIGVSVVDNWGEGLIEAYEMPVNFAYEKYDEVNYGDHIFPTDDPKNMVLEDIRAWTAKRIYNNIKELSPEFDIHNPDFQALKRFDDKYILKIAENVLPLTSEEKDKNDDTINNYLQIIKAISYHLGTEYNLEVTNTIKEKYSTVIDLDEDDEEITLSVKSEVINIKEYKKLKDNKDVMIKSLEYEDKTSVVYNTTVNPDISPLGKRLYINVTGLTLNKVKELNDELVKHHHEEGRYKIIYRLNSQEVPTEIKVIRIPYDMIESHLNEKNNRLKSPVKFRYISAKYKEE